MGERINMAMPAIAIADAFSVGGQVFRNSLARSAAQGRYDRSLAGHRADVRRQATVAIAQRDLAILLDL